MRHGDFTDLAEDYAKHRPGYAPSVLDGIVGLLAREVQEVDAVDVGAGTGIWTRMLDTHPFRSLVAVEPNAAMRTKGIELSAGTRIEWRDGSAERTGLADLSADLVTMASSFHWADLHLALAEFDRVLRPGGCVVALWNPRYLDNNPLLVEIEEHLRSISPALERVSSGSSGIADRLTETLEATSRYRDVTYLESKHQVSFSAERYLGVWRSVNDLQVQLGQQKFEEFLRYLGDKVANLAVITATYRTRAWVARKH